MVTKSRPCLSTQAIRTVRTTRAALIALDRQHASQARANGVRTAYTSRTLIPTYRNAVTRSAAVNRRLERCRSSLGGTELAALESLQTLNAGLIRVIADFVRQLDGNTQAEERLCAEQTLTIHSLQGACANLEAAIEQAKNGVHLGLGASSTSTDVGIGLCNPELMDRFARDAAALAACESGAGAVTCNTIMGSHSSLVEPRAVQAHAECEPACWMHKGARHNFLTLSASPAGGVQPVRIKPRPKTRRQPKKPAAPQ